jgi:uncharacterized protein with HEPN domain
VTPKQDHIYLEHILECAALIQKYTSDGEEAFMDSALLQDAVLRRLQTMAESTQRLSKELKAQAIDVDWRAMAKPSKGIAGFRNVLVHEYMDGIDLKRVWNVVKNSLPELEATVRKLMKIQRG